MHKIVIISAFAFLLLTSCDPAISYEYRIENQSQNTLEILVSTHSWWPDSLEVSDTLPMPYDAVLVVPQAEELLLENSVRGSNPHDEKEDFLENMASFRIQSLDSTELVIDYYKREYWTYRADIGHAGFIKVGTNFYTLQISDADFE